MRDRSLPVPFPLRSLYFSSELTSSGASRATWKALKVGGDDSLHAFNTYRDAPWGLAIVHIEDIRESVPAIARSRALGPSETTKPMTYWYRRVFILALPL